MMVTTALVLAAVSGHGAPYTLTPADRAELTTLARTFFESTRDGSAGTSGVYPTMAELRALFPAVRAGGDAGLSPAEEIANRQLQAIERDVREARTTFAGGTFRGLAGRSATRPTLDLRPCGRFARADSQCADGPAFEYEVGGETRRYRIDTLVRVRGHWKIFDVRP
jgi:hypothetical protein